MEERRIAIYFDHFDEGALFPSAYLPPERQKQLSEMKNPARKKEMEAVWSLLGHALSAEGMEFKEISPTLRENGQWVGQGIFFSLAHEGSWVAVALGGEKVGIDLVLLDDRRITPRLRRQIAAPGEEASKLSTARLFASKEAIFKREGGSFFDPKSIDARKERDRLAYLEEEGILMAVAASTSVSGMTLSFIRTHLFETE